MEKHVKKSNRKGNRENEVFFEGREDRKKFRGSL